MIFDEKWVPVFGWVTASGAVASLVVMCLQVRVTRELDAFSEAEKRAFERKIVETRTETDAVREKLALAEKTIDAERAARLKLEAGVTDRTLGNPVELATTLRSFQGEKAIVACALSDEPQRLCTMLDTLLKAAGWKSETSGSIGMNVPRGVRVDVVSSAGARTIEAAKVLAGALTIVLSDVSGPLRVVADQSFRGSDIRLLVGHKMPPASEE